VACRVLAGGVQSDKEIVRRHVGLSIAMATLAMMLGGVVWLRALATAPVVLPEPMGTSARAPEYCPPELFGDFDGRLGPAVWMDYQNRMGFMNEPLLACGPSNDDETYRFTWVHAFTSRAPIMVRLSRSSGDRRLVADRYEWRENRHGFESASHVQRSLTEAEWKGAVESIRQSRFWSLPGAKDSNAGADGSTWMLEGRRGRTYHLMTTWSPQDSPFRRAALTLLRLAGFDDPEPRF